MGSQHIVAAFAMHRVKRVVADQHEIQDYAFMRAVLVGCDARYGSPHIATDNHGQFLTSVYIYIYLCEYIYIYMYICVYINRYPPRMTALDNLDLIILIILGAFRVYQAH